MDFELDGAQRALDADAVRAVLHGRSPEEVRTHWVEIEDARWPPKQVLALATGLHRRTFTSHRALGLLARLGFATSDWPGRVRPERRVVPHHRASPVRTPAPDILLVGCSGSKATSARPARELFTGAAFRKARDRAETLGLPWYVLSAEHGLLVPDEIVAPYDVYLPDQPSARRSAWGAEVVFQLARQHELRGTVIEAHAGRSYCDPLIDPLADAGAVLLQPLAGLRQGERLAWYGRTPASVLPDVAAVLDAANAVAPADLLAAGRAAADDPGLYTWWVDATGAAELSSGLGHVVAPGLVYAGRAGGVRASGARSTNTLWGRIATMHLRGRRQFSTIRLTLSACLSPEGGPTIPESELTTWMHSHLRVATLPLAAEDVTAGEARLLELADPPLNLRDVARTDLRRSLSRRRSALPAG
ncbi:hypothetical protein SAMN05660464_3512 [Geodermatophilus dictyosporus]|uniref:Uncharacterized protein n=1 Tax=Geodermatophilus dictyosporus TaxID=1523247 RepID=A0A1I5R773_9ACTN|nr:DUF6884 domain-containing protein [Geodermatophilus dictyosporus]SFP54187.1 hypothetical protein SAMN05660464_3512 [Geodermatophilus dictyosporus]